MKISGYNEAILVNTSIMLKKTWNMYHQLSKKNVSELIDKKFESLSKAISKQLKKNNE